MSHLDDVRLHGDVRRLSVELTNKRLVLQTVAEKLSVDLKGRVKLEDAGFDWKVRLWCETPSHHPELSYTAFLIALPCAVPHSLAPSLQFARIPSTIPCSVAITCSRKPLAREMPRVRATK